MYNGRRSRGVKVKNVLQICVLLAVCFWLIYQVKQSHEKKKQFGGNESSLSQKTGSSDGVPDLGRKSLPDSKEIGNSDEQDKNSEEKNEDLDERDQENDSDDSNGEGQDGNSEDSENDEDSGSKHEAQEVLYKADDASSAVTHDTTENENSSEEINLTETNVTLAVNNSISDSNSTTSKNKDEESSVLEKDIQGHPRFTTQDDRWSEKSETVDEMDGADEKFESFNTENIGEIEDLIDSSDSSFSLDEKEVRTDVETLPEIQTEGSNTEDVAAK